MQKDKGAVEYSMSVMLLTISVLLLLFSFRLRSAGVEKAYVEDALAMANLSAAVIDTNVYGKTEELYISEEKAYERFKESLRTNLELDAQYMPRTTYLMESPVKIAEFHIYNMEEDQTILTIYDEYGEKSVQILAKYGVRTPNGKSVKSTTIYSKIEFDVKGFLYGRHRMTLENSVDVVKNK